MTVPMTGHSWWKNGNIGKRAEYRRAYTVEMAKLPRERKVQMPSSI